MVAARDNPFATGRAEELLPFDPGWIGDSWEAILGRLGSLGWRGAVVGRHGSGKTTFLESLTEHLNSRGWETVPLFLNRGSATGIPEGFFHGIGGESIVLFDGAEQLGWLAWRRFLRRVSHARGLVITGHRAGRLPTLLETGATPEILLRCIRILDGGCGIDESGAERLFRRHSGNIRHALLECYDAAVVR